MLRITSIIDGDSIVLKVEGKLLEPWLGELRDACAATFSRARHTKLDLTNVSYVDSAGAALLHGMIENGVTLAACSSFVSTLLTLEKP